MGSDPLFGYISAELMELRRPRCLSAELYLKLYELATLDTIKCQLHLKKLMTI